MAASVERLAFFFISYDAPRKILSLAIFHFWVGFRHVCGHLRGGAPGTGKRVEEGAVNFYLSASPSVGKPEEDRYSCLTKRATHLLP